VRADGLARPHGRGGRCQGTGYRLARWPVEQRLVHYTGSVFEIVEDLGGRWGDYLVTCVWSQTGFDGKPMEEVGRERVFHGEYLHRDGWVPDLMHALHHSLTKARA
jgi:hypothetical protein